MRWDYKVDFSMSLVDIEMAIEKGILYHQGQILSGDEYTYKLIHMHTNIE